MQRPTPEEIAYARMLINDPKHLPEERSVRSSYLTSRAMGLIQFAAGDTLSDPETNLRRIRAAIIAEREAQNQLYPELYRDTDTYEETSSADPHAPADEPHAETEPARTADATGPAAAPATQDGPPAASPPEVTGRMTLTAAGASKLDARFGTGWRAEVAR